MNYSTTNSSGHRGGAFSATSCPAWWEICHFLRAIKTNPHLYPGVGWVGVYFDWCIKRENSSHLGIVQYREFHNSKEIHRRIAPAAPSNSFSKDNKMSQPQPQKKERSTQATRIELWCMKETVSFSLQNYFFSRYAWMSFRHMTSFSILNNMSKRFRFRYF